MKDNKNFVCPHCERIVEIEIQTYLGGETTCNHCGKTFLFHTDIDITFVTRKDENDNE